MSDDIRTDEFSRTLGFTPDPFQVQSMEALAAGRSVLVAAPTGAGKTVVGEYCCHRAIGERTKCFYTTPIKALSNQKYRDLCDRYGDENVGLLTGDRSVNGDAPVVVMTTEVLRNMLYARSSTLTGLRYVVLDEVHYLADRERGAVWEEVLIQLPASVQVAALSATVSNAEEFGDWLSEVRDGCDVIIEEQRPVPLRHHYFVNGRIYPTFRAGNKKGASAEHRERASQALAGVPNPDVLMLERRSRTRNRVSNKGRRQAPDVQMRWPSRQAAVAELAERRWLPAIFFVFSRNGCEKAVEQFLDAGVDLTSRRERDEIARTVDTLLADLPDDDLAVLDHSRWREGLLRGVAAHHAGMVPAFKEAVEVCFQEGLLKVVVATETLALGINMPAKTVVIERLEKWNGDTHEMLTPGQYTQLTGRAGRRGIDKVGHAVVLHQRGIDFKAVAGLVGTRSYPLRSSFAPSYNMAVNLLRNHSLEQAETLLGASFAQFQADRDTAHLGRRLVEAQEAMAGYEGQLVCDRGDWSAYWELRMDLTDLERDQDRGRKQASRRLAEDAIIALRPGEVVHLPWIGRRGLAAVTGVQVNAKGTPIASVVTDDRSLTRLGPREFDGVPVVVDRVRLPMKGNPRQREYRADVTTLLRAVEPPMGNEGAVRDRADVDPAAAEQIEALRQRIRSHPCHACEDRADHETWQHRMDPLLKEVRKLRQRIERRTGSLVRQFHQINAVLSDLGYLDEVPEPTEMGQRLCRIYSVVDLLVSESLRLGVLDGLDPAEVAAVCALFLYEPRGGDVTEYPEIPTEALREASARVQELAIELRARERAAGLEPTRELDAGFMAPAWRWASGRSLDESLGNLDLTGGDFVRNVKQMADLAGQLQHAAEEPTSTWASLAVNSLRRGIVEA